MPTKDPQKLRIEKRRYYLKHRENILAKSRQDYAENPEKFAAKNKASSERHSEKRRAYRRRYYLENREKILAQTAAYHTEHAEEYREYQHGYRSRNHHKKSGYQAKYQEKHSEKLVAKLRLRRQVHPEILAAQQARRRARKANAPHNDLTAAQWREIKEAFDHRCAYCGRKMKQLTQDHVTPYAHNGSHTLWNVIPACKSCNSKKHDGPVLAPVQPLLLTIAPSRKPTQKGA